MQTRTDKSLTRYAFGSLVEFGDYIANAPATWTSRASRKAPAADWDMNIGYDQAVKLAQGGWIEGAERAQDALKAFAPMTPEPDTKVDFFGYRPHVPRFCAGAPDSMIRRDPLDPLQGRGKVVTLLVPISTMWWVTADQMANFGVGVAQYVNQLETLGTRVEVLAGFAQSFGRRRTAHTFVLKYADQPLDLAVLAFAIGHPACLRRLGFAAIERSDAPQMANYGIPEDMKLSDLINPAQGTFILNGMVNADKHAPTPEKAFEYVSQQIEKAMEAQYADQ